MKICLAVETRLTVETTAWTEKLWGQILNPNTEYQIQDRSWIPTYRNWPWKPTAAAFMIKTTKKLEILYPWWSRFVHLVEKIPMQCLTSLVAFMVSRLTPNSARFVDLVERIRVQCVTSLETFRVSRLSPDSASFVDHVSEWNHTARWPGRAMCSSLLFSLDSEERGLNIRLMFAGHCKKYRVNNDGST